MATILVVEDERDLTDLIGHILQLENHTVITCASASEGIASLEQSKPDLILLDIWMEQDWAGLRLLHHLRANSELAAIPAIVVTAKPPHQLASHPEIAQVFDVIPKPFEISQLLAVVNRALAGD